MRPDAHGIPPVAHAAHRWPEASGTQTALPATFWQTKPAEHDAGLPIVHVFRQMPLAQTWPVTHAKKPPFGCTPQTPPSGATSFEHAQMPLVPP